MGIQIALLRAVNVGGRSMSMAGLREMLAELGLGEPRTLLQSGNAVFASPRSPAALEPLLEKTAAKRFGLVSDFFVRSGEDWEAAIAANPFVREARDDPSHLLLMALKAGPTAEQVEALKAAIQGRERLAVKGRHAYVVYPDGIGRSQLTTAFIEARLGTRATGRNWNTARKLAALARGA